MSNQPGRNDPCHCGSGRKYKHCHLRDDESPRLVTPMFAPVDAHDGAAKLAIDWLHDRHPTGFRVALDRQMEEVWPEDVPRHTADLDADVLEALQINLTERLLAEGEMQVKGAQRSINEYVTGPAGPRLSDAQRRWMKQLGQRALHLYTVTDVRAGEGLTLCDALDPEALALVVQERSGSRNAKPGMVLGARVMHLSDHLELSGAIYPFSLLTQQRAIDALRSAGPSGGQVIARAWLRQFLVRAELPRMIDASTGEPILLVTDHYRVHDAAALALALAAQPDVKGDAQAGWHRDVEGDDGALRVLVSINPGKTAERIELFCRTQQLADAGRAWFEGLAGAAVQHLTREITDPRSSKQSAQRAVSGTAPKLPPEVMAKAMDQLMHRLYARWADEPIPLLADQTPRQAMATAAGLERVKGLLRSYEDNEAEMAQRDGRPAVSLEFMWESLGITR